MAPPSGYVVSDQTTLPTNDIVVGPTQVTSVCIGPVSAPSHVCVGAVYDEDRCGSPTGHTRPANVQVDIWREDKRLGCIQTVESQDCTRDNWLEIKPGLKTVIARPTVQLDDGRQLRLAGFAPLMASVMAGETRQIVMRYVAARAEIHVSAALLQGPDSQRTTRAYQAWTSHS